MLPLLLLLMSAVYAQNEGIVVVSTEPVNDPAEGAALPALGSGNSTASGASPALGGTACDINPSVSVPTLTSGTGTWGAWWRPTSCINALANGLQAQVVVRNPSFYQFGLFVGNGAAQCPSSSGAVWSPDSFTWPAANSYTGSTTSVALIPNQCTSNAACCVVIVCGSNVFNCASMTVSVTYVAPPPTTCGGTNLGLTRIPSGGLSRAIGCQFSSTPPSGSTQDFSLSNPNGHSLTVWLTDGTGPQGCGLPATNPTGAFSYNFYQVRTRAHPQNSACLPRL